VSDDDGDEEEVEGAVEEVEEPQDGADDEDNRPEIEADERADVDALREQVSEVSDEVAEDDGLEPDDADDEDAATEDGDESAERAPDTGDTGDSVGDMYVGVVGVLAIAIAEELGDGETDQDADDIAAMLRGERGSPINVAANVDQLLEESGRGADLPPGKAVVIGTVVAVGMVLLQETDLANSLVSELLSGDF
jgi:hypothetical protein